MKRPCQGKYIGLSIPVDRLLNNDCRLWVVHMGQGRPS